MFYTGLLASMMALRKSWNIYTRMCFVFLINVVCWLKYHFNFEFFFWVLCNYVFLRCVSIAWKLGCYLLSNNLVLRFVTYGKEMHVTDWNGLWVLVDSGKRQRKLRLRYFEVWCCVLGLGGGFLIFEVSITNILKGYSAFFLAYLTLMVHYEPWRCWELHTWWHIIVSCKTSICSNTALWTSDLPVWFSAKDESL